MGDEVSRRLGELSDELANSDAPELEGIQSALAGYQGEDDHHDLSERIHDWILRFESSHPELSRIMARVLDAMPGV